MEDSVFTVSPLDEHTVAWFSNSEWFLNGQAAVSLPAGSNLTVDGGSQFSSPSVGSSVSTSATLLNVFALNNANFLGVWNAIGSASRLFVYNVYFEQVAAGTEDPLFRYTDVGELSECSFSSFESDASFLSGSGVLTLSRCVFENVMAGISHSGARLDVKETSFVIGVNMTLLLNRTVLWWRSTVDVSSEATIQVGCIKRSGSQVMFESDSNSDRVSVDCSHCLIADASVVDPCPNDYEPASFWNPQSIAVLVIGAALLVTIIVCLIAFFRHFKRTEKDVYESVVSEVESGNIPEGSLGSLV